MQLNGKRDSVGRAHLKQTEYRNYEMHTKTEKYNVDNMTLKY